MSGRRARAIRKALVARVKEQEFGRLDGTVTMRLYRAAKRDWTRTGHTLPTQRR